MTDKRLLIITSHVENRIFLEGIARRYDYVIQIVESLTELQDIYFVFKPTLIMLDIHAKNMDGVSLINYLHHLKCQEPIVIIGMNDERLCFAIKHLGESKGLKISGMLMTPLIESLVEKKLLEFQADLNNMIDAQRIVSSIEEDYFVIYYQPKIEIKTKKIYGLEALIRLQLPHEKIIFPDSFITLAEETGLIVPLTHWGIRKVFEHSHVLNQEQPDLKISINLSPKILNDLVFSNEIENLIKTFDILPKNICFEITESGISHQSDVILEVLTRLRIMGFSLSIDDFGTGYSSVVELQRLPFTELKIDKQFIMEMLNSPATFKIVKSLIDLGHNLDLELVAEGVDKPEIMDSLLRLNCDIAQGYFISKPLSLEDFSRWRSQHVNSEHIWNLNPYE